MNRFNDKKVLVTGSSRGIGKAVAIRLAAEGAELVLHYHHQQEEVQAVADGITGAGGKAHILQADLFDINQAIRLGHAAWDCAGRIDFLVNNAGVCYKKHFLDATIEDVDYFTNINFKSSFFLTQCIAKKMVARHVRGGIYTITSINGIQPGVGLSTYGASKGALETLMKGVALELAPHQISVNTIAIGAIRTDMTATTWQDEEKLKLVNDNIPLGRLGEPEEIAAIVCDLLLSGTYMTGATITVDGGWMLKQGYANPRPYGNEES